MKDITDLKIENEALKKRIEKLEAQKDILLFMIKNKISIKE